MAGYKRAVFLGIFCTVFFSSEEVLSQQEADRVIYTSEDYWKNETPLQCYDCNSEYDPRCGDPFNPYSIGVVNCSEQKPPEHLINPELHPNQKLKPTVCRKIVQKVEGYKRVIRECGYIQDKRDDKDCVRRTGTINVEVHYCACTGSLCNDDGLFLPNKIDKCVVCLPDDISTAGPCAEGCYPDSGAALPAQVLYTTLGTNQ